MRHDDRSRSAATAHELPSRGALKVRPHAAKMSMCPLTSSPLEPVLGNVQAEVGAGRPRRQVCQERAVKGSHPKGTLHRATTPV
eukprot:8262911-Alexandrium_andersonii.AAC.1